MPMFVSTNGILVIFALLNLSKAITKLSVAPSFNLHSSTRHPFLNTTMRSTTRESRYLQNYNDIYTNDIYQWRGITPQVQRMDYAYTGYHPQVTTQTPTFSVTYPYITTSTNPTLTRLVRLRPQVTKLQIKPVKSGVKADDFTIVGGTESSEEEDLVPLVSIYGMNSINRWATVSNPEPYDTYSNSKYSPTKSTLNAYGQNLMDVTGDMKSGVADLQESGGQQVPIIATVHHHTPKLDLRKIGIIALVKIGLAKLKAFGLLKLLFFMLLKLKLFLLGVFIKFIFFLKALKLLKSLLIPLLLLSLLPLILLPLLALPLLLPLLQSLPAVPTVMVLPTNARIRLSDGLKTKREEAVSNIMHQFADSEKCIERIACHMATKREAKLLFPIISWYLSKVSNFLQNEKITLYVKTYTKTVHEYNGQYTEADTEQWCAEKFSCALPEKASSNKTIESNENEARTFIELE